MIGPGPYNISVGEQIKNWLKQQDLPELNWTRNIPPYPSAQAAPLDSHNQVEIQLRAFNFITRVERADKTLLTQSLEQIQTKF